jgi:low temperature requirement protein LtrA
VDTNDTSRAVEFAISGKHPAERHRALFVIALGEAVLAIGSTLTGRGFDAARTVAFVVTFLITALIWRIYIFRAGEDMGPAIEASANPTGSAPWRPTHTWS